MADLKPAAVGPSARRRHRAPLDLERRHVIEVEVTGFAAALGRLAVAGVPVEGIPGTIDSLVTGWWQTLYLVDQALCRLTFAGALSDRAPIETVVFLAEILTLEAAIRPQIGRQDKWQFRSSGIRPKNFSAKSMRQLTPGSKRRSSDKTTRKSECPS